MTFEEFEQSLSQDNPPDGLSICLKALWWDARNDWDKAHETAQDVHNADGSWVHAYLHRKEGDSGNASYWYSRAGRPVSQATLKEEWKEIVEDFLAR